MILPQNELNRLGLLEELARDYRIFMDTCSLMHLGATRCLEGALGDQLVRHKAQVVVPVRVVEELRRLQRNGSSRARKQAERGEKLLARLQQKGLVDLRGEHNDTFADNVFLYIFTQLRLKCNLALFTQDTDLTNDICGLRNQRSVQTRYQIRVFRIRSCGALLDEPCPEQAPLSMRPAAPQPTVKRPTPKKSTPKPPLSVPSPQKPFRLCTAPRHVPDDKIEVRRVPGQGDWVTSATYGRTQLIQKIAAGGEGSIYSTDRPGLVCKIYKPERLLRSTQLKIELMLRETISVPGICWPKATVASENGVFAGYLMDQAAGQPMQHCMFIKAVLKKNFPHWTRRHLVELTLTILEKIGHLHARNIIIGDINPLNILIKSEREVYLVDTDSYQIEDFACPVGTVNFSAPEIQGKDYKTFLRTFAHEYFAVATLVFMILLPGKPPYSQQGGGSPAENIRRMDFSYPKGEHTNKKTPDGPWKFIWSNLPYKTKEAFHAVFKDNQRLSTREWHELMRQYLYVLDNGYVSDELYPTQHKIIESVDLLCAKCGTAFLGEKSWAQQRRSEGKDDLCNDCVALIRLKNERLKVRCSRCGQEGQARKKWLADLRSQGKDYVCKPCHEQWRRFYRTPYTTPSRIPTYTSPIYTRPKPAAPPPPPKTSLSQPPHQPAHKPQASFLGSLIGWLFGLAYLVFLAVVLASLLGSLIDWFLGPRH